MNKYLTKQYAILVMNKRFNINSFLVRDFLVATIAAGLFELEQIGVIKSEHSSSNITFSIQKVLPDRLNHLSQIYNVILDDNEKTLYQIIKLFNIESTNKYAINYVQELIHSMIKDGLLSESRKAKLFGKSKMIYSVNKEEANEIIENLRNSILYDNTDSEDSFILAKLLDKSGLLRSYFQKEETIKMSNRIQELIKGDSILSFKLKELDDLLAMSLGFVKLFT